MNSERWAVELAFCGALLVSLSYCCQARADTFTSPTGYSIDLPQGWLIVHSADKNSPHKDTDLFVQPEGDMFIEVSSHSAVTQTLKWAQDHVPVVLAAKFRGYNQTYQGYCKVSGRLVLGTAATTLDDQGATRCLDCLAVMDKHRMYFFIMGCSASTDASSEPIFVGVMNTLHWPKSTGK